MKEIILNNKKKVIVVALIVVLLIIGLIAVVIGNSNSENSNDEVKRITSTTTTSITTISTTTTTTTTTITTTTTTESFKKFDKSKTMYVKKTCDLYKDEACKKASKYGLKEGDEITITAENRESKIYQVKYNDEVLYIKAESVTEDKPKKEEPTEKSTEAPEETPAGAPQVEENYDEETPQSQEEYSPSAEEPEYEEKEETYEEQSGHNSDMPNGWTSGAWYWSESQNDWVYHQVMGDSEQKGYNYVVSNSYLKPSYTGSTDGEEGNYVGFY